MIVKVCGITHEADARAAVAAGANALGYNFWPRSPRFITPDDAARFAPGVAGALRVGVFVDSPPGEIARVAQRAALDVVQLHGSAAAPAGIRYWRAAPVRDDFDPASLHDAGAEAYLLDAPSGALHGGTGRTFDWSRVRGAGVRVVLAGGLDGSNVAGAIAAARPWGVDACSRLESSPGRKDHAKVAAFVAHARAAFSSGQLPSS
jgi:phosphoribosylanthranilate isomerase